MVRCEDAAYSFHHLPQMTQCSILRRLTSYCAGPMPLLAQIFQSTLSVRRATVQLDIFVHFLRRKPAAWL